MSRPFSHYMSNPRWRIGSLTVAWLQVWASFSPMANPPCVMHPSDRRRLSGLSNGGCMTFCEQGIHTAAKEPPEMRIMKLQPAMEWFLVWSNLHKAVLADGVRSASCMLIQDIIPTVLRLHRIRLTDTDECTQSARQDTLLQRLTECAERQRFGNGPVYG
jgi:hypothetical protein